MHSIKLRICFVVFTFGLIIGCETKQTYLSHVRYIKPPKWVLGYGANDIFFAIGITSRNANLDLSNVVIQAEKNAIENLRTDVLLKFENSFIKASMDLPYSKRGEVVKKLNQIAYNAFEGDVLKELSRREELWVSPDDNAVYLMVSGDCKQIASLFISELNKSVIDYKHNPEMLTFISKIKNDTYNRCFKKKTDKSDDDVLTKNNVTDSLEKDGQEDDKDNNTDKAKKEKEH